ncbi:MAG: PIG-L family deacetylase [Lachnospiraceae bacterium]|nr:PIG-L family deacetylase [Lachnospiraceae bacterium]MCM1237867.1 PIG-L family deacetylase [Lachnospiraceae bacterium]
MRVLVIAPHADDEILGVGGTIAKYVEEGNQVDVCIVTVGQTPMFSSDAIAAVRHEALEAHKLLGVHESIFLEFPAVLLSQVPRYEINGKLCEVITKVRPDIVFIPHFGDMHYDHMLVAQAAMVAVRPINECTVKEVYAYETLSESEWNVPHAANAFIPNTYIDISKQVGQKREAMSCYRSQVKMFPHPRSIEALDALAKLRGSTVGVCAAEAFCLLRRIER